MQSDIEKVVSVQKLLEKLKVVWPMAAFQNDDAAGWAPAGESDAAECKVDDGGSFSNCATASSLDDVTNNYQLTPDADSEAEDDAVYFGDENIFCGFKIDLTTDGVFSDTTFTPEYYNGSSWASLSSYIINDGTKDSTDSFEQDGIISFKPPSDWAKCTIDSEENYWVRWRISGTNITTTPVLNSVEQYTIHPIGSFTAPYDAQISAVRLVDKASTLHTAADVKFALWNSTKGTISETLTFSQDKAEQTFSLSTALDVYEDDVVKVILVTEDGTNAPEPVLELMTKFPQ